MLILQQWPERPSSVRCPKLEWLFPMPVWLFFPICSWTGSSSTHRPERLASFLIGCWSLNGFLSLHAREVSFH